MAAEHSLAASSCCRCSNLHINLFIARVVVCPTRRIGGERAPVRKLQCQIVCPGHFHFTQKCTHDRCVGYWGIEVEDGIFGATSLAVGQGRIVYDAPQKMADGGWVVTTYIDFSASTDQLTAMEKILSGEAGGPVKILARFVAERKPTRRTK